MQITQYEGFFTEGGGMDMKTKNQELAREASGLLICVFTYLLYAVYSFYIQRLISDFKKSRVAENGILE